MRFGHPVFNTRYNHSLNFTLVASGSNFSAARVNSQLVFLHLFGILEKKKAFHWPGKADGEWSIDVCKYLSKKVAGSQIGCWPFRSLLNTISRTVVDALLQGLTVS